MDTSPARPPPRPYASVRPCASSVSSRESPNPPPTTSATGPRPFGGGSGSAAARSSSGANCQQRCPCQAPPRRSRTSPTRVPTGASSPQAAPFDAVTTSTVSADRALQRPLDREREHRLLVELAPAHERPDERAVGLCERARGSGSAHEHAWPDSTPPPASPRTGRPRMPRALSHVSYVTGTRARSLRKSGSLSDA